MTLMSSEIGWAEKPSANPIPQADIRSLRLLMSYTRQMWKLASGFHACRVPVQKNPRMLGHSLKGDVTNGVYGHRSVAELKHELEKIEGKERAV